MNGYSWNEEEYRSNEKRYSCDEEQINIMSNEEGYRSNEGVNEKSSKRWVLSSCGRRIQSKTCACTCFKSEERRRLPM